MMTARTGWLAIALSVGFAGVAIAQDVPKTTREPARAAPQAPPAPQQPAVRMPQAEALLVMIRSALIGLEHANRSGNYSVLREIGGPALQQHSSGRLSDAFATLRANNIDLLPAAVLTPQLLQNPTISPDGVLQLVGYVPTQPRRIEFQIVYQVSGGQWRLAGLNVGLGQPPPPETGSVPKAAAPAAKPKAPEPAAKK